MPLVVVCADAAAQLTHSRALTNTRKPTVQALHRACVNAKLAHKPITAGV